MQIEVKNNNFIKLDNLIKVHELKSKINEYNFDNNRLSGLFEVEGTFLKKDIGDLQTFNYSVPFDIIFTEDIKNIESVELIDFEFFEIEGRGIEFEGTLIIRYNNSNPYQIIKEEVDDKLQEHLDVFENDIVEDRILTSNSFLPTKDIKTKIKIQF